MSRKPTSKPPKPPTPAFGSVLPPPKIGGGDADGDAIFLEVGRALTAWEHLEELLADIFAALTGEEAPKGGVTASIYTPKSSFSPARRAFGSIQTFRGRSEMLLAAGEAYFLNKAEKGPGAELKSLITKCGKLASRRNEIAHGVVIQYNFYIEFNNRSVESLRDPTWYLMPAMYNSGKTTSMPESSFYDVAKGQSQNEALLAHLTSFLERGRGSYKYNSSQVNYYREQFVALYHNAKTYRDKIFKRNGE